MPEKFLNKYRIPSARLKNWDYASNGSYFITICTHNRFHYFGEIHDKKMNLSEIGKFAEHFWHEIPKHFTFMELGAFVVMPDHVHGILIINRNDDDNDGMAARTHILGVQTPNLASQTPNMGVQTPNLGVSIAINQYKRICTISARKIHSNFAWQSRFYDHIIRNDESFQRISKYIIANPANWKDDKSRTISHGTIAVKPGKPK